MIQYTKVQIEDCQEIFEKSVQGNETIERLLYQKGGKVSRGPEDIPFIAKQTRIVLKNCGKFADVVAAASRQVRNGFR